MQTAFRDVTSLKMANATIYQMQIRYFAGIVPLNARLAMLTLASEDESALEEKLMEEMDELDTL
jgi:hypothetical protein